MWIDFDEVLKWVSGKLDWVERQIKDTAQSDDTIGKRRERLAYLKGYTAAIRDLRHLVTTKMDKTREVSELWQKEREDVIRDSDD